MAFYLQALPPLRQESKNGGGGLLFGFNLKTRTHTFKMALEQPFCLPLCQKCLPSPCHSVLDEVMQGCNLLLNTHTHAPDTRSLLINSANTEFSPVKGQRSQPTQKPGSGAPA